MRRQLLRHISEDQRAQARRSLPGISPVGGHDWIRVTEDYADQMGEKAYLTRERLDDVYTMLPAAKDAASELLLSVVDLLARRPEFEVTDEGIRCPDRRVVALTTAPPMLVLSQLIQEDLCILLKKGTEHYLMGALLCFPASWTLSEKIGQPLRRIHQPVDVYDDNIARRVQRLFDGVQVGQPLWRANSLRYAAPTLFHPRQEVDPPHRETSSDAYVRSERQTVLRLPVTGAVVFAIHTTVALI